MVELNLYDYTEGCQLTRASFYALIAAAMLKADTENADKLQIAFPDVWTTLQRRHHSPGGTLPEESVAQQWSDYGTP